LDAEAGGAGEVDQVRPEELTHDVPQPEGRHDAQLRVIGQRESAQPDAGRLHRQNLRWLALPFRRDGGHGHAARLEKGEQLLGRTGHAVDWAERLGRDEHGMARQRFDTVGGWLLYIPWRADEETGGALLDHAILQTLSTKKRMTKCHPLLSLSPRPPMIGGASSGGIVLPRVRAAGAPFIPGDRGDGMMCTPHPMRTFTSSLPDCPGNFDWVSRERVVSIR